MSVKPMGLVASIIAAVDLAAGRFVGFDGNLCGANAKALGVAEVDTAAGEAAPVQHSGIGLVVCGGSVSKGAALASDANGKAVTAAAVTVSVPSGETAVLSAAAQPTLGVAGGKLPQAVNGYALEDGEDGDRIQVRLS
ncbi:MAG: DUF2190 family protein [Elusimicrobia bacterium]|nr:DUF2190 family protein [Elusimicrobiota bacterium]